MKIRQNQALQNTTITCDIVNLYLRLIESAQNQSNCQNNTKNCSDLFFICGKQMIHLQNVCLIQTEYRFSVILYTNNRKK